MAEKDDKEIKIFKLNRIKFAELYEDALAYIKATYKAATIDSLLIDFIWFESIKKLLVLLF